MKTSKLLAIGVALSVMIPSAIAHEYKLGLLTIVHPWARATPPGARVAAGYLTVTNTGSETDTLIAGTTRAAKALEFHRTTISGGVARMRPIKDGIKIPPGETVKLEPGAAHIMFMNPSKPLKVGNSFPARLRFEKGGEVSVRFNIVPIGGRPAKNDDHAHRGDRAK